MITNMELAATSDARGWCIAGGYAACPPLASDIDVWVLGDKDTRARILRRLMETNTLFVEEQNDDTRPLDFYDLGNGILCWKVAKLEDGRHIIVTDALDAEHLLENFDVSTHQIAITSDGRLVLGPDYTPITAPPVRLRQGTMTDTRMEKIATRYAPFQQVCQ